MKKSVVLFVAISIATLLVICNSEEKPVNFSELTKSYFDKKNELSPLDAMLNGQMNTTTNCNLKRPTVIEPRKKHFFINMKQSSQKLSKLNSL